MKISKKVCKNCPFRKNSIRGYTTFDKKRYGMDVAANGMLRHIEDRHQQICHSEIIKRKKDKKACLGALLFYENEDSPMMHPEIFNNIVEFETHHIVKNNHKDNMDRIKEDLYF